MGGTAAPPGEALDRLTEYLGTPSTVRLLSDRRGSRVWKVSGPGGAVALKADNPDFRGPGDRAAETAQENDHLTRLTDAGALDPGYRVDTGTWDGGRWLALRWVGGIPVWRAFAHAIEPEMDRQSARPRLLGIARTWAEQLARLHAVGWTHADVQPTNTLITDGSRAVVIDYALACGPGADPCLPYRGALTHTTAPEIAGALLTTSPDTHVQAEPPADVWSLGASLYWCWTRRRPVAYDDAAPRTAKLRAIARTTAVSSGDGVRPWRFPEFEEAVHACLAPTPADRPSAAALVALLSR